MLILATCNFLSLFGAPVSCPWDNSWYIRTGFAPQFGAVSPVSPWLARHNYGIAEQLNRAGSHMGAERREVGLRCMQNVGVVRVWQMGSTKHPVPLWIAAIGPHNRWPVQPNQKDFSARPKFPSVGFPQVSREDCPRVNAAWNAREDLTFRSLSQASSALNGYMKNFPGLTQSLFHHGRGTRGGRLESKGCERGNYYMDLILWRTA